MRLGVIDFSEKHANIGTLFWATVFLHLSPTKWWGPFTCGMNMIHADRVTISLRLVHEVERLWHACRWDVPMYLFLYLDLSFCQLWTPGKSLTPMIFYICLFLIHLITCHTLAPPDIQIIQKILFAKQPSGPLSNECCQCINTEFRQSW